MIDKTPYTPGMREVLKLAKAEAGRLGHDYIGPEHYLLGVIRKGDGLALQTLMNLEIDPDEVKLALEQMVEVSSAGPIGLFGPILFAPNADAKRVLETAKQIARELKHGWVGTEHLLLALLKEENTLPGKCLHQFGLDYEKAKKEIVDVIEGSSGGTAKAAYLPPIKYQPPISGFSMRKPIGMEVQMILMAADKIARDLGHETIWPEHLLLALLQDTNGPVNRYLSHFGIDYETAKKNLLFPLNEDNPEGDR